MTEDAADIRPTPKRKQWLRIAIVVLSAFVILFAFLWESVLNRAANETPDVPPHQGRSAIQDKVAVLDWVDPAFLPLNEYSRPGFLIEAVNTLVIHYIGNPNTTAAQNRDYFAGLAFSGETYASSNFIIGLNGEVIQCVPVDEIAYASNTRNDDTLSIELCHPDETGRFTDDTYDSAVRLSAWLCTEFSIDPGSLIRHFDVTGKECPKYFVDNEDAWIAFRSDVSAAMHGG